MKICKICHIEKELNKFKHVKSKWDHLYYANECRECKNKKLRTGRIYSDNRGCVKYNNWKMDVLERDGNKCMVCGVTTKLVAHHIIPWNDSIELRFELSNGQTLCIPCHMRHHKNSTGHTHVPWNKGLKTGVGGTKKGAKFTLEHRENLRKAHIGRVVTDETRKRLKEAKTPENIEANKLRYKGRTWKLDSITGKRVWFDN